MIYYGCLKTNELISLPASRYWAAIISDFSCFTWHFLDFYAITQIAQNTVGAAAMEWRELGKTKQITAVNVYWIEMCENPRFDAIQLKRIVNSVHWTPLSSPAQNNCYSRFQFSWSSAEKNFERIARNRRHHGLLIVVKVIYLLNENWMKIRTIFTANIVD